MYRFEIDHGNNKVLLYRGHSLVGKMYSIEEAQKLMEALIPNIETAPLPKAWTEPADLKPKPVPKAEAKPKAKRKR